MSIDQQYIEPVAMVRAIGQQHRPASVSVVRDSVTCACGHESTNPDGLEEHRATLIVEWLLSQHAAMLDALTRHGVLTVEEAWVPVAESGERWKRRDKDTARRDLSGWPAGGCYTSGDPWDGITHIERETRHVSQWEVTP